MRERYLHAMGREETNPRFIQYRYVNCKNLTMITACIAIRDSLALDAVCVFFWSPLDIKELPPSNGKGTNSTHMHARQARSPTLIVSAAL